MSLTATSRITPNANAGSQSCSTKECIRVSIVRRYGKTPEAT